MHLVCCGSGDPVLFIHGMPTSGRLWNGIIKRLCTRYKCFSVDLPGLGESPREAYGPDYLRRLAEEIDAIRIRNNIDKWHVVGHDAGAVIAVHYAHYYQDHVGCMALLSPALFPELKPFFLIEPLRKRVLGEMLAPFIGHLFWKVAMQRALAHAENGAGLVEDFHKPFSGRGGCWQFMRVMRWGKPSQLLAQVPEILPRLLMPTLIFHGSRDAAIPRAFAVRAASLLPNAKMVTLDSGHFIPLNQPESVAASLDGFFGGFFDGHVAHRADMAVATA